jgi:hypothetical protein
VGGVVADEPEGVVAALARDDLDRLAVLEWGAQVAELAVLTDSERGPREPLPDRPCGVGAGGAVLEL